MFENIGPNLRRLRRERDLTQQQLARFAGIHQQYLSALERGLRPRSALLDRLAQALGVSADDLLRHAASRPHSTDRALCGDAGPAKSLPVMADRSWKQFERRALRNLGIERQAGDGRA